MPDERNRPSEINDVAPTVLDKVVGQRSVVDQVRVGLEAAWADGHRFAHSLLVGPPGLGKSSMCSIIAREVGSELHEVLGQSIAAPSDLNTLLLSAGDKDVVLIDEAHELSAGYQTSLYRAMDERKLFISGDGQKVQAVPVADFTLLLATTDEFRLLQPLRDRMRMVLRFDFHTDAELAAILEQRTRALGWRTADAVIGSIAARGRGTPRLALRLLESVRRVCRSQGDDAITTAHLRRACDLEQLDPLGLDRPEQDYLRILKDAGGPVRLNVIASRLGLPPATVGQVIEPYLLREGLVWKNEKGRGLTAKGREHLDRSATTTGASA